MEEIQTVTVLWAAEDHLDTDESDGDLGEVERVEDIYTEIHPRSDELERRRDEPEVKETREAGFDADSSSREIGGKWTVWTRLFSRFSEFYLRALAKVEQAKHSRRSQADSSFKMRYQGRDYGRRNQAGRTSAEEEQGL